jgi:hypothetical protein
MFASVAPICLVGYLYPPQQQQQQQKREVSEEEDYCLVSTKEGEDAARQIGAMAYIEWTEGSHELPTPVERLMWYGYYRNLSK